MYGEKFPTSAEGDAAVVKPVTSVVPQSYDYEFEAVEFVVVPLVNVQ